MNKKQKKVLKRIIVAAVLLVIIGIAGSVVSIPKWLEFLFYLVPYFVMIFCGKPGKESVTGRCLMKIF